MSPSLYVTLYTGEQMRLLNVVAGKGTLEDNEKSIFDGRPQLEMNQGNNKSVLFTGIF